MEQSKSEIYYSIFFFQKINQRVSKPFDSWGHNGVQGLTGAAADGWSGLVNHPDYGICRKQAH